VAHPNEDLLRRWYGALGSGDMNTVIALFADDMDWHVGGSSRLAGDYHGPQGVMELLGKFAELSGGSFRLDVHDILANDTHGVGLVTGLGRRGEQTLALRSVDIWHLADGKATEFWSFPEDPAQFAEFFG
jgi:uncharacterized protein